MEGDGKIMKTNLLSFFIFVVLIGTWEWLAADPYIRFLFGSPASVYSAFIRETLSGTLPYDFFVTGLEAFLGFVVGTILGIFFGFLLWYSPLFVVISRPYRDFLGSVPMFAFAPMIIIWFGVGFLMKAALVAFSVFLVVLTQAYEGAQSVDERKYGLLKTYGVTRSVMLRKVVFPSSLSWVFASMRLSIGFALLGAFVGEFFSSTHGLGHAMIHAGSLYDIPTVLAGGLYLVALSCIFSGLVNYIERHRLKIIDWLS